MGSQHDTSPSRVLAMLERVHMDKCKPMEMVHGQVHLAGGLNKKQMQAVSKSVGQGMDQRIFLKLTATERWLLAAVTGSKSYHGSSFGTTSLLEALRKHVIDAANGEFTGIVVDPETPEEEDDPMAELDDDDDEPAAKRAKPHGGGEKAEDKRKRYSKNQAKGKIVQFPMQVLPPQVDPNAEAGVCDVLLYIVDRQQIWIDSNNVDWAVRYLYAQNILKGVPLVDGDDQGPDSPGASTEHDSPSSGSGSQVYTLDMGSQLDSQFSQ